MPIVQITLVQGRDRGQVKQCVKEVARVVARTLNARPSTIRVYVQQVPPEHWAVGEHTRDELESRHGPLEPD